ncbi:MAG: hypothetical protein NTZ90_02730, partial [Proteobacteria bacterium]|nr:hypothetical protein [Pseudomonadota bacterium]
MKHIAPTSLRGIRLLAVIGLEAVSVLFDRKHPTAWLGHRLKHRFNIVRFVAALFCAMLFTVGQARADQTYDFVLSGRLTETNGKPVSGPVSLKVVFAHDKEASSVVLTVTEGLDRVTLQEGLFQIRLTLNASDYQKVFPEVSQPVWFQVSDLTHNKPPFPPQQVVMVPYAAKVPVDGKTLAFDSNGTLSLALTSVPSTNQFLTKDSKGNLTWGTPDPSASALRGQNISTTAPATGQVLKYDGSQWLPSTITSNGDTLTGISGSAPVAITGTAAAPAVSITQATSVSPGYLSAADWLTFNAKQPALGFT